MFTLLYLHPNIQHIASQLHTYFASIVSLHWNVYVSIFYDVYIYIPDSIHFNEYIFIRIKVELTSTYEFVSGNESWIIEPWVVLEMRKKQKHRTQNHEIIQLVLRTKSIQDIFRISDKPCYLFAKQFRKKTYNLLTKQQT